MYCFRNQIIITGAFISILLLSCEDAPKTKLSLYFDTEDFFESEKTALLNSFKHYKQTVILNGVSESKDLEEFSEEKLKEFENLCKVANINQTLFKNEYQIDTFWMLDPISLENIEVLNYTTKNKDLKVQSLQVYSNGSLKASIQQSNLLFSSQKDFYYEKNKKINILSWQKTLGQDTLWLMNEVIFQ